ncbi:hypothetical protein Ddye_018247 [Dipteronia dyeriana]|uniref:Uncharacterized protein n=1 Tax=Dipteronia dyeriana TaxID=168575 RepID=A0AAD9UAR5_9ROSI|nr:hypothetical protein Ddye_018247 [Dipteronia dyeriana]
MEKNELSGIPDDPDDPVVTTDDPNTCALVKNTSKEIGAAHDKFEEGNNHDILESCSSKHEKHQPDDTTIEIKQLEEILGVSLNSKTIHEPVSRCCIYKVPRDLRNIDIRAYTPQVISIGPFHHGKHWLSEMENQKSKYMLEFLKREGVEKGAKKLKEFKGFIEEKEQIIRSYYQENSTLVSPEFVKMILRDAVFIIEFFLKNVERAEKSKFDFYLDTTYVRATITRDLQLLENQLPYFVLKSLFAKGAFHKFTKKDYPHRGGPFLSLSHLFFFGYFPEPDNEIRQHEIQHFTDLRRCFLLMDLLPRDQKQGGHVRRNSTTSTARDHVSAVPTATKLHWSGVKFKKGIEGRSSLGISCEYVPRAIRIPPCGELQIPFIKEVMLQIPRIEIDDRSECLYRNMMAWELCHYPYETHICNFILLMECLINTKEDVDFLVDQKIIFSSLGDNAIVATMFNNLTLQITPSHSVYHSLGEKLKAHYDKRWSRTMATLKTVYFVDLLTSTKTVAAVVLLVLTFIQTVYSVL